MRTRDRAAELERDDLWRHDLGRLWWYDDIVLVALTIFAQFSLIHHIVLFDSRASWWSRTLAIGFLAMWCIYLCSVVWILVTTFAYRARVGAEDLKRTLSRSFADVMTTYALELPFEMSSEEKIEFETRLVRIEKHFVSRAEPGEHHIDGNM
jgi:hypothetical protein